MGFCSMFAFRLVPLGMFSSVRLVTLLCVLGGVVAFPFLSLAHEGHDHDDASRAALASSTYPRVVAQSDLYEVAGILRGDRLSLYLDNFVTNEPVTDAKLRVTIGQAEPIDVGPAENGVYTVPFPRFARPESVEIIFSITAPSGDDLLVGPLALPQDTSRGGIASQSSGSVALAWIESLPAPIRNPIVLTLVAFALGVLFGEFQRRGRIVPALASAAAGAGVLVIMVAVVFSGNSQGATAPVTANAAMSDSPRRLSDGTAFVAKPTQRLLEVRTVAAQRETVRAAVNLIGRVIGDPNRTSLVQSIHGGRVLPLEGGLPRIGQSVRKGEVLAQVDPYLPLADRTTISEKTGEIEQLIAIAEAKLRRMRPLAESNALPRNQVADIETELAGLRARREVIRNTRTEPELLRAPTDGVITSAKVVPGQVVQAQDILFQIVDPGGLWVEALVYGAVDPASLADATAVAIGGQAMPLAYRGFSRALQQHASLVHFAIADPPPDLSVGQPVTVMVKSGAPTTGIVIRRDAVARNANGEAIVWLHVEPERFEPRPVRTQPFDAPRLVIAAGISEGDRIVVRGTDLINQVR